MATGRPNILLIVSDQERQRGWLPSSVELPNRHRLIDGGLEFTNYWTHSSPCSPSRASLMTGQYVPRHGVKDNVIHPWHVELDPATPTTGTLARKAGYRSSYIGKWHLSQAAQPDMEAYGYSDWEGNDKHFMGWAGTGVHFDPVIAEDAAHWLRENGSGGGPWFLTVALVNPHDVMWFPIDQPDYQATHTEELDFVRSLLEAARWKDDETLPAFTEDYAEVVDTLPANFDDDLHTKPEAQRQWRWDQQHGMWGYIDPKDTKSWLRVLDYYVKLHQMGDDNLGTVLDALDASGAADDTIVMFTSDHGDMCGSHGLRSKGPFIYNEIMHVPLYVRGPGVPVNQQTDALATHVDLAATVCGIAGIGEAPTVQGVSLEPVLADPNASVRDHVLFAMDSAHTTNIQKTRYALRGFFDGRTKYARYYGVGGGFPNDVLEPGLDIKLYPADADFDDQDHELYDLHEDPHELVNLAMDRGRRTEVRERFNQLLELESRFF